MWNLCRPAALAQLQRAAQRAPVLRASSSAFQAMFARSFGSDSTVAGVEMSHLLNSTPKDLAAELGKDKIGQVHRALTQEFANIVAKKDDVTSEEMTQLFAAAQKTRLSSLMVRSFNYMKQHFPDDIDFVMYGEVFRILSRERDGAKLYDVYEFARPRFEPAVPELIYRYGIVGKIELGDMEAAHELVEAMQNDGHFVTNEIYSRLMAGYAREKNIDQLVAIYDQLDPSSGHWHESSIDRVILSLGVAGKPDLAFEFYVNSNMMLNGGTLITLLSVCRHNDCRQQAADILENRKRFNLKLDARAYNGILQTLEFLDRHDDIPALLDEMTDEGIRFDTMTKQIVARNQDVLKGTYFDLSLARERSGVSSNDSDKGEGKKSKKNQKGDAEKGKKNQRDDKKTKKMSAFISMPELKALLAEKKFAEAAALADQFVRPLKLEDLAEDKRESTEIAEGALRVPASIAKEAVLAFIGNGELDKVDGLLKGFAYSEARVGFALMEIMLAFSEQEKRGKNASRSSPAKKFSKKESELAYRAAKTMVEQGWQIFRVSQALSLFRQFGDAAAARQICEQQLLEYAGQDNTSPDRKISAASLSQTLVWTLRTLAEANDLRGAFAVLDKAEETGFRVQPSHYVGLLNGMRLHSAHTAKQKGVVVLSEDYTRMPFYYMSDDFAAVLDDMDKRGVRVTRGVVANACFALADGDKFQRTRLLEAYAQATEVEANSSGDMQDRFEIPTVVYSVLMHVSGRENPDLVELRKIYDDAVASLKADSDGKKRLPHDWEVIMVSHLADAGFAEEAATRLKNMINTCGSYSYEAMVKVLRGSIAAKHEGAIKATLALVDERSFKFTLSDAYDLVHAAKHADLPSAAFEIVTLYERAHGRSTEDVLDHVKSRQTQRDKFAMHKIRSMYRTVLQLCEQNGQWKLALSFSQRVNELLKHSPSETEGAIEGDKHDSSEATDERTQ